MSIETAQNGSTTETFSTGTTNESQQSQAVVNTDQSTETTFFSAKAPATEETGKETNQTETPEEAKVKEEAAKAVENKSKEAPATETKTETEAPVKPIFKVKSSTETSTETPKTEEKKETLSVTDESVISFLKTKGLDIKSLDEVSKKQALPDAVEEFKKFHEKTGRGMKAYYNANKDWKEQPKDSTLREFYKYQNPEASEEDINTQLDLLSISEEEEEDLSPRELKKIQNEYNQEYNKALKFMQGVSNDYNLPREEQNQAAEPPTPEQIAEAHRPYWEQRDKSLESLNEIRLPIEGLGDINLPVTQEQKDLISKHTMTHDHFFKRWRDEEGKIDTDKSSLDMAWSIPEIRDELISNLISESHTLFMEQFSKEKRNVTLGKPKTDKESQSTGSMTTFGGSKSEQSRMGTPLIQRR